jgi:hypothetical protein
VAYLLSAVAALVYLVAAVALARDLRRTALLACGFELVGVLVVGTLSLLLPDAFPDQTVWSGFGIGYGFIPLVLPVLGLLRLRRHAVALGLFSVPSCIALILPQLSGVSSSRGRSSPVSRLASPFAPASRVPAAVVGPVRVAAGH